MTVNYRSPGVEARFCGGTTGYERLGSGWWRLCSTDTWAEATEVAALLALRHDQFNFRVNQPRRERA